MLHAIRHVTNFIEHKSCFDDTGSSVRIMEFYCSQAETIINGTTENEIERVQRIIREYLDKQPRGFSFTLRGFNQNLAKAIMGGAEKIRMGLEALIADVASSGSRLRSI